MKYEHSDLLEEMILQDPAVAYIPDTSGISDSSGIIMQARAGVRADFLFNLAQTLDLSQQEVADILHISLRTYQRFTPDKLLDTDQSVKVLQLAALFKHGIEVFGRQTGGFSRWLRKPVPALGGQSPLSYLDTPFGFEMVHQTLGRIEHGIIG